jgi:hypothetical protein
VPTVTAGIASRLRPDGIARLASLFHLLLLWAS